MIHYALCCGDGHEFDGWFRNSASFEDQSGAGLLVCPVCASSEVRRALMSPRIAPRAQGARVLAPVAAAPQTPASDSAPAPAPPAMPAQMRAALQRIRGEIEARCEYVGPRFASVVRGMAERDTPARPVYGEATQEEAAALAEEGIDVARIPWVPRADS